MSEINFAKEILKGRNWKEVSNEEILFSSQTILENWMSGEIKIDRPKLYDHYAMIFFALIKENLALKQEIEKLKNNKINIHD